MIQEQDHLLALVRKYGHSIEDNNLSLISMFWTQIKVEIERLIPRRGKCGYRYHHEDCECNGEGGSR